MGLKGKILVISDNKEIFDYLENSLGDEFLIEKMGLENLKESGGDFDFILSDCDYSCKIEICFRKFLYFLQNKEIPFAIVRPFLLEGEFKSKKGFFLSFWRKSPLSLSQNEILKKLKSLEKMIIHPSNTLFKILKVQREIVENPEKNLELSHLSKLVNLSPSWLSFKFKEITGTEIVALKMKIRYCFSLWEIIETEKKIGRISYERGYRNHRSFTKGFRSLFGITPSIIRKEFETFLTKIKSLSPKIKLPFQK